MLEAMFKKESYFEEEYEEFENIEYKKEKFKKVKLEKNFELKKELINLCLKKNIDESEVSYIFFDMISSNSGNVIFKNGESCISIIIKMFNKINSEDYNLYDTGCYYALVQLKKSGYELSKNFNVENEEIKNIINEIWGI